MFITSCAAGMSTAAIVSWSSKRKPPDWPTAFISSVIATTVRRLLASLDVATSSSISEAFPLVVGEAMACGVPCVVTDVGDSALIVGPFGKVVPPRDPAALAQACLSLFALSPEERHRLGQAARGRIAQLFDLDVIVSRYERLYEELAAKRQPRAARALFANIP